MYGITAAPGKAPNTHMVSVIAGLTWPPDALPAGLRISPKTSTPTAAPMMSSRTLTVGIAEEIGEGATTQRTNVLAPNSRTSVMRHSRRLRQRITAVFLRDSRDGAHLGRQPALLYPAGEFSQLVAVRLDHEEHRAAFGRADPRLAGYRDEGPAGPDHCRGAVEHLSADHVQHHIHLSDLLEPLYV